MRRVYLNELEEGIAEGDFKPTITVQKSRKVEFEMTKLAVQCNKIHEDLNVVTYFQFFTVKMWMFKYV